MEQSCRTLLAPRSNQIYCMHTASTCKTFRISKYKGSLVRFDAQSYKNILLKSLRRQEECEGNQYSNHICCSLWKEEKLSGSFLILI